MFGASRNFYALCAVGLTKHSLSRVHSMGRAVRGRQPIPPERLALRNLLLKFANDASGATAIEYGLIASLIALVIIASVTAVGTKMTGTFNKVSSNLH
jgi:pilus assembly protein Flp/PilA